MARTFSNKELTQRILRLTDFVQAHWCPDEEFYIESEWSKGKREEEKLATAQDKIEKLEETLSNLQRTVRIIADEVKTLYQASNQPPSTGIAPVK